MLDASMEMLKYKKETVAAIAEVEALYATVDAYSDKQLQIKLRFSTLGTDTQYRSVCYWQAKVWETAMW